MQEIRELLNNLQSADWWERKNALKKLLSHPEDSYISILEQWLKNDDDALQRNIAMEAYRALGARTLQSLLALLREDDSDVRVFAATLLGDIKDDAAVTALVEALADEEENARIASAESLGRIGDEKALEALELAISEGPWVAVAAIEAIGHIGGSRALSILHSCLKNTEYRSMVINTLEKAGNEKTLEYLRPYVNEPEVRELALKAVVAISEREKIPLEPSFFKEIIPLLIELQDSPHDDVRKASFIALSRAKNMKGVPYFLNALHDEDLQEYALNGLILLGRQAVPEILRAMKDNEDNRAVLAKILSMIGAHDALLAFAGDNDNEVRTEVALAAGALATQEARDILLSLAYDPSEEVRKAAHISLRKFSGDAG